MTRRALLIPFLATLALNTACADDTCPDRAGSWTVVAHCESEFVGQTTLVTQSSCGLSMGPPFSGLSGSVGADGTVTIQGTVGGGMFVDCQGTSSPSVMNLVCDGCNVSLQQ